MAATVVAVRPESRQAARLVLDVPGWPGHLPGQHLVVRLTAEDGYSAQRSYSVASAADGTRVELVVERLRAGEVSPYLADGLGPGDQLEVRGPIGLHFVWDPTDSGPVQLIAGGSGVAPFLAMLGAHAATGASAPMRLLYSVRAAEALIGGSTLAGRADGVQVTVTYTRRLPPAWTGPTGRVDRALLDHHVLPPAVDPAVFVCGPSGFVEVVTGALVELGHRPERIRTERFGPSGTSIPGQGA